MSQIQRRAAIVFGIFVVIGILLPAKARVERETDIDAYPATVFSLINDFRQVNRWSGWAEEDPNAGYEITGVPRGVGASMSWQGQIIGAGQQSIIASEPYS